MYELIVYVLIGRLLVYLAQSFPFQDVYFIGEWFEEGRFLGKLVTCDLCIGVWIYFFLAISCRYSIFGNNILGQFLTGASASFIMHIFAIGWQIKFGIVEIK